MRLSPTRPTGVALALAAALTLGACGSGPATPAPTVTVTATPPTASDAPSTQPGASAPAQRGDTAATRASVRSAVQGRAYDLGTVVRHEKVDDTLLLTLDRWTDTRVPDDRLARSGVTPAGYDPARSPFRNHNTKVTFVVPVSRGAAATLRTCTGGTQVAADVPVERMLTLPAKDAILVVSLDPDGWVTTLTNIPAC